ncbi:hypothetical protein ABI244_21210 [Serratia ureilytica]|uniref:hypothetical protein n=1 Tax=Serratia TaxID=613 RepID=UPI0018D76F39|nr:hypothetical protein [Serratia ureilytica]MBH2553398.1 hypothetical protein [Serratia ureilytica]
MDVQDYFSRLNSESQWIFKQSILKKEILGELHHLSSCIYEFSVFIVDQKEKTILETVSTQLESSNYNLTLGLYRQAFSSLRLALEMGLAAIYFSASKLELHEWLDGRMDIKWSRLIDEDNGVLSKRFAMAFFSDLIDDVEDYRKKAISVYRKLSEYVHGNNETWVNGGIKIVYNEGLFDQYCTYYRTVFEVILFSSMCRYVKSFDESDRESLQFLPEEFSHILKIRELFGRS